MGLKIKRNDGGCALNQTHYIEKVVSKFSHLKIKDANTPFEYYLGEVDTILGIKRKRNDGGCVLNQTHYIEKVDSKFSHLKIKDANTPLDSSVKLEKHDGRAMAQLKLQMEVLCMLLNVLGLTFHLQLVN